MSGTVSVIIPSFNSGSYIAETLNSVLAQNYKDWECLVIDDGSTDKTLEIINDFSVVDGRFKLIYRNRFPKGAATCRNIGMEKTSSDYIVFVDSDDLLSPWCLKNRVQRMQENPDLDVGIFNTSTFHNSKQKNLNVINRQIDQDPGLMYLGNDLPFTIMSTIWKSSFIYDYGRFREYFQRFQDPEFYSRIFCLGRPSYHYFDSESDSYYRKIENKNHCLEYVRKGYLHFFRNWTLEVTQIAAEEDRMKGTKQIKRFANRLIKNYFIYNCENNYKLSWLVLRIGFERKLYSYFQYKLIKLYLIGCKYGIYRMKGFGLFAKKLIFW